MKENDSDVIYAPVFRITEEYAEENDDAEFVIIEPTLASRDKTTALAMGEVAEEIGDVQCVGMLELSVGQADADRYVAKAVLVSLLSGNTYVVGVISGSEYRRVIGGKLN